MLFSHFRVFHIKILLKHFLLLCIIDIQKKDGEDQIWN